MKPGTRVRLSEAIKVALMKRCTPTEHVGPFDPDDANDCWACSFDHVKEFGDCIGIVQGEVVWNPGASVERSGPEVDVKWMPSGLCYAYHPDGLEVVVSA